MLTSLSDKRALVCASTKGLGFGAVKALLKLGATVGVNGRTLESVQAAMAQLESDGFDLSQIYAAPGDVSTPEGRALILQAAGSVDILINNNGGPPPGSFLDWDEHDWRAACDQNMIAPIMLAKAVIPYMKEQKWGRIVNITSGSVRAPIPHLGLSNGARAGLTGAMAGIARQVAHDGITINNVLPGQHETDRLTNIYQGVAKREGTNLEQAWQAGKDKNPTQNFGQPDDFGAVVAFLCTAQAKFIVGQNILVDGGAANINV